MLILSRRESESICLGDDIVLTIVAVGRDKVRIGVTAPAGVRILRNELEIDLRSPTTAVPFAAQDVVPQESNVKLPPLRRRAA